VFRRLAPWSHMNEPYLSPYRRSPSGLAWAFLFLAGVSLCFSVWVTVLHPRPGGFFVRYGSLSLGITMISGAIINLLSRQNRFRSSLWLLGFLAFIVSLLGLITVSR
jgi:hypothetical protein